MVRTEPTPATLQIPLHHDDAKKSGKKKRKSDADEDEEGILKEDCEKAERRREKRLRKAERRKRQDAKNKAKDRKDEDIANSKPVDQRVLSPSLDRGSGGETQCVRAGKKKKKRPKPTPVNDKLNRHTLISTDKRTLEGEHRAKKRRRGDQGP